MVNRQTLVAVFMAMFGFTQTVMAEGFSDQVTQEGTTGLLILALVFLGILLISLLLVPVGYMFAQKHAKALIENDRDKYAGAKMVGIGIVGAIASLVIVWLFYGTVGSFLDPSMSGDVDFNKGTHYIFSHFIGAMLDKALGIAQ